MTPDRKAYLLALTQFPQMTVNESAVARQWLQLHADEFDDVTFNQRLGSGQQLGPGFDATQQRQAELATQKRADLVARKGAACTIVEVKERVSLSALGQLLGYAVLFQAENPDCTAVSLVAIGYTALLDVHDLLAAHGVKVELFPDLSRVTYPPL